MNEGDRVKSLGDGSVGTIWEVYSGGMYYVEWDDSLYSDTYDETELIAL